MDKLYKRIAKIGRQYGAAKVVLYGTEDRAQQALAGKLE